MGTVSIKKKKVIKNKMKKLKEITLPEWAMIIVGGLLIRKVLNTKVTVEMAEATPVETPKPIETIAAVEVQPETLEIETPFSSPNEKDCGCNGQTQSAVWPFTNDYFGQ